MDQDLRDKILRGEAFVGDAVIASPEEAVDLLQDGEALVFDKKTEQLAIVSAGKVPKGKKLMVARG